MSTQSQYPSRNAMKRAFREGKGRYDDGQSSYSVNCQNARARGRRPMSEAVKIVRQLLAAEKVRVSVADAKTALIRSHDGEWHHASKFGNRVNYYCPGAAIQYLRERKFNLGLTEAEASA